MAKARTSKKDLSSEPARIARASAKRSGERLVNRHSDKSSKLMEALCLMEQYDKSEMTIEEIAGRVGIGYSTLKRWLSGGVPKSLRVPGEELDKHLKVHHEFMRHPGRPKRKRGRPRKRSSPPARP